MSARTTVKSIQDLMRQDVGVDGDAQRLSQLCWMFFLKIIDDQDQQLELMQDGFTSPIPPRLQWRNWAADPEGWLLMPHGEIIERYGYAAIEKMQELVAESGELEENLCVAAHLAHVAYAGRRNERGEIVPRYNITLASQIDEATCHRVNLGYMDFRTFRREDYENDPETLIVENAGRDLYLVEPK